MKKKILIITGPTAVGKTRYAVKLAKKLNGEIISADSMQVYKYMNVGTAKTNNKEKKAIKHYLIGIIKPDEEFNVSKFVEITNKTIQKIIRKGKTPIIVGGTGLYLKSLVYGYKFPNGEKESKIRKNLNKIEGKYGINRLYKKLVKIDPKKAEKIHKNDAFRIKRALEVYYMTGRPMSQQEYADFSNMDKYKIICLTMEREKLYQLIDRRVDAMIKNGLIKEVKKLIKKGYNKNLPALKAIGYKEIIDYLDNKIDINEAVNLIKKNSRHLAKKQLTWFRSFHNIIYKDIKE